MGEMLSFNQNNNNGGPERPRYLAPMLETVISKKIFSEGFTVDEGGAVGERQAVVILNPTKYTIREDDDVPSANDDIHSSLNDSAAKKTPLLP
jgi:hypothetical protein